MQYQFGSCTVDQIAVLLACPFVSKHPGKNKIIVHGGVKLAQFLERRKIAVELIKNDGRSEIL